MDPKERNIGMRGVVYGEENAIVHVTTPKRDDGGVGDGDVRDMLDLWSEPALVYFCKYISGRVCR